MNNGHAGTPDRSRRDFLRHAGLAAAALGSGLGFDAVAQSDHSPAPQPQSPTPSKLYNILFIVSDQVRFSDPTNSLGDIACQAMNA